MDNIKLLLSGFNGKMGQEVQQLLENKDYNISLIAGVDANSKDDNSICTKDFGSANNKVDCVLDFSNHLCTDALLNFATKNNLPLVIATTGQTDDEILKIKEAAKFIPIFFSANMSLGVSLLIDLAKRAAQAFPDADIEIVETHHSRKVDAPSGTAKMIFNAIKEVKPNSYANCGRSDGPRNKDEIGIQSIRYGNVSGIHEVIVSTNSQTITLKHEALNRTIFAEGAMQAIKFLVGKPNGLYTMQDLLK